MQRVRSGPASRGLVGRSAESRLLHDRLDAGLAVAVVGEAGVGKTALLRAVAGERGTAVYEGCGLSMLSWRPYLSVTRALGQPPPDVDPKAAAAFVAEQVGDGVL